MFVSHSNNERFFSVFLSHDCVWTITRQKFWLRRQFSLKNSREELRRCARSIKKNYKIKCWECWRFKIRFSVNYRLTLCPAKERKERRVTITIPKVPIAKDSFSREPHNVLDKTTNRESVNQCLAAVWFCGRERALRLTRSKRKCRWTAI